MDGFANHGAQKKGNLVGYRFGYRLWHSWILLGYYLDLYGFQIGIPNLYSKSVFQIGIPNRYSKSVFQIGIPNRYSKSVFQIEFHQSKIEDNQPLDPFISISFL